MKKLCIVLSILFCIGTFCGCSSDEEAVSSTSAESDSLVDANDNAQSSLVKAQEKKKEEEAKKKLEEEKKKEEEVKKKEEAKKAEEAEKAKKEAEEKAKNEQQAKQNKITIVVDPGHSSKPISGQEKQAPGSSIMKAKDTSGTYSPFSGLKEYSLNMNVARKLKAYLEQSGFNVIMTKNSEEEDLSNIERAEVGNKNNAALVIRLHGDSFSNSSAKGASMLVPSSKCPYASAIYQKSKVYGEKILHEYLSANPINNRGIVERDDMTGFNWSKVPVVLIEMGFLSNANDSAYLSNAKNYDTIAKSLAEGIKICFN